METSTTLAPSTLSTAELERLRLALTAQYPLANGILGSQLGAFIRRHLTDPDLKRRFGGLKDFIARYFPAEIAWRGRQGLDDLYDICFSLDGPELGRSIWQRIPAEPSSVLWSAVTNPSISVQFAWSATEKSLLQASAGVALLDELTAIEKLTKVDYQNFAMEFVDSQESIDTNGRAQAIEKSVSSTVFTKLMRDKGLLAKWEEFRIGRVLRTFTARLAICGAEPSIVDFWAGILRSSQQMARSMRRRESVASLVARSGQPPANREYLPTHTPDSRTIAIKTMEFLSDSDLSDLNLPLGAVMRALRSLTGSL